MKMFFELFAFLLLFISTSSAQIRFSVCDGEDGYGEHCINLGTIAHCDSVPRRSASVEGMWMFTGGLDVFGRDDDAIGEFLYQDRIGVPYHTFKEQLLKENGGCWRRIGHIESYNISSLSLYRVTGLLSDSSSFVRDNHGNNSFCLDKAFGTIKSFAVIGNSEWTLTTKSGESYCLTLKNNESLIPGLVPDTNYIGIAHGDICSIRKDCKETKIDGKEVKPITIDNTITTGTVRRTSNAKI